MNAGMQGLMGWGGALGWVAAGVLAAAVAGCGSLPDAGGGGAPTADAKAATVKQRAEARWAAMIKGDSVAAYEYLSPGSKAATSLQQYILSAPRGIRVAEVTGVECAADTCKVHLSLTYDAKLVKGVVTPHVETWLIDKGQWWYFHRV